MCCAGTWGFDGGESGTVGAIDLFAFISPNGGGLGTYLWAVTEPALLATQSCQLQYDLCTGTPPRPDDGELVHIAQQMLLSNPGSFILTLMAGKCSWTSNFRVVYLHQPCVIDVYTSNASGCWMSSAFLYNSQLSICHWTAALLSKRLPCIVASH